MPVASRRAPAVMAWPRSSRGAVHGAAFAGRSAGHIAPANHASAAYRWPSLDRPPRLLRRTIRGRETGRKWRKNMRGMNVGNSAVAGITDRNLPERRLRGIDLNLLVVFDALMAERHVTRAAAYN